MMLRALGAALFLLAAATSARTAGEWPSVVRPHFEADGKPVAGGSAFFLEAPRDEVGVVAVAAAHSFDRAELSRASEVEFRLGRSGDRVAVSSRLYTEPGRPFTDPGATLREDFLVFALDTAPRGVAPLPVAREPGGLEGARVRILGVPAAIAQDEDDVFGRIDTATPTRIEVKLDVPVDLRGWGGAPVLRHPEGDVVGILEAAWPEDGTLRLGVAPIEGVLEALEQPLDGGLGRPFAAFDPGAPERLGPPQPDPVPAERPFSLSARRAPVVPADGETLLGEAGATSTKVHVEVETPADGAIVGDEATGAFVGGRAVALLGELRRFDVMLVIDTSESAGQASGADINSNGVVGENRLGGIFGNTDAGDSILAAEVAAARRILRSLDPRNARVGLVSFSGEGVPPPGVISFGRSRPSAVTEEPLTADFGRVEEALDRVLARGAEGMTHMAAAVDLAYVELFGFQGAISEPDRESEKVVLFFTDGTPTMPYDPHFVAENVRAVLRAADRAARLGTRIHAFAIGPEALEGPVATVEMAARTGGYFTPVRHPGDLVEVIENVSFANLEGVSVRNVTTGHVAQQLQTNPDGTFGALVPLEVGKNVIEVVARAADGAEGRAEVTVSHAPGAPRLDLPRELVGQRNRLLEQRLVEIKRERLGVEREAVAQARKELQLEIERERSAAQSRAAEQRKELNLEVLEAETEETAAEPPAAQAP